MEVIKENLIRIAGKENVADNPEILHSFSGNRSFAPCIKPWFAVKPGNVEKVQELVKWANETETPLVPVSSGTPHIRGASAPSVPGAVIVDLSNMKKILNINRRHKIAVVEPGVTYGELQPALAKEGMTLSTSLAPRASKSVTTSVLEVEPRLNPIHQWNYIDPLRCVEVVFGDGNRIFTGEAGGGVLDLEKQWAQKRWQVSGAGPMMLDFIRLLTGAQGSMGIVTWASLKCEILPQIHKLYILPARKSEELNDFVYKVLRLRFSDELMVMNGSYLASLLGNTPEEIDELKGDLPAWVALVGIAGRDMLPEMRVEAQEQDIADIAQQCGLKMCPSVPGARGETVLEKIINPSGDSYWKETYKGAFQDIFFITTLDKTPKFIEAMYFLSIEKGYPVSDMGVYIQPQHGGTCCHLEFSLPYDPQNAKETAVVKELYKKAGEELINLGAYFSRPYGIWSRLQLNRDAQSTIALKKLKGIFDPNNIMNPGKVSI